MYRQYKGHLSHVLLQGLNVSPSICYNFYYTQLTLNNSTESDELYYYLERNMHGQERVPYTLLLQQSYSKQICSGQSQSILSAIDTK